MRLSRLAGTALLAAALAACGATQAPMAYAPTVAVQPVAARGAAVAVSDRVANERRAGRDDPTWIGTIRGGYGNPLKQLNATEPVDRVVASAFRDALAARGLGAGSGPARYELVVTIHQFDANQYVRREATADFGAALVERATGRQVWSGREKVYTVDGSLLSLGTGVFASVEDLRRVALQTMNQAVDRLLDKPDFRAALRT